MPSELLGPLAVFAAYLVFVWWLWREVGWVHWARTERPRSSEPDLS
jgi:hypothetical protein